MVPALLFDLESLAEATNYILLVVFIMINPALWVIKSRQEEAPEGVRTYPVAVPVIGVILNVGVLVFQIYETVR